MNRGTNWHTCSFASSYKPPQHGRTMTTSMPIWKRTTGVEKSKSTGCLWYRRGGTVCCAGERRGTSIGNCRRVLSAEQGAYGGANLRRCRSFRKCGAVCDYLRLGAATRVQRRQNSDSLQSGWKESCSSRAGATEPAGRATRVCPGEKRRQLTQTRRSELLLASPAA